MPAPQNGQTHSNELFECVWPFYSVGAERVKGLRSFSLKSLIKSLFAIAIYIHCVFASSVFAECFGTKTNVKVQALLNSWVWGV